MTLSGGHYGGRRRNRAPVTRNVLAWTAALVVISAAGLYAYRTGTALAMRQTEDLRAQVSALTEEVAGLEQTNAGLQNALEGQQARNLSLLEQYRTDVPDEESQEILRLVRGKLAEGVPAQRLSEIVEAAAAEWECASESLTRRFVVQTPTTSGSNAAVSFAEGTLIVTGTGISELDAQGRPLAWYNPAEPISLSFTPIDGEPTNISGLLPLQHSMVIGESIYRFSALAGETSFVNVTGVACAYP
jgi:hypothetical protein